MASLGEAFVEVIADTSPFGNSLSEGIGSALAGVEGEVADAFAGVGGIAEEAFGEVVDAADSAGNAVGEGIDEGASEAQDALDSIDGSGMADRIMDNIGKITLGFAGLGAASEGFARRQGDTNAVLGRVALATGIADDELREMIGGMVDHTFAAEDAAAGMERLARAGITSSEDFATILPLMDTFADATGKDVVGSIDLFDRALSALGIPLSEAEEHMDALGFIANQTTVPLDNLGMLMRREAASLREYGLSTDDIAIAMAALEAEGIRGPRTVMAFQSALAEGEGNINDFWQALGVSNDTLSEQAARLSDSAGMVDLFADNNNAAMTVTQRFQANMGNLLFRFGGLADAASLAAAPIAAIGPVMMGINATQNVLASGLGTKLVGALRGAGTAFSALGKVILANPIFLIAAVIIGLGLLFWKFRDQIIDALKSAWDWVKEKTTAVFDWFRDAIRSVIDWVKNNWTTILAIITGPIGLAVKFIVDNWQRIRDTITKAVERVIEFVRTAFENLRRIVTNAIDGVRTGVTNGFNAVVNFVRGIPRNILNALGNVGRMLLDAGRAIIQGLWDGMRAVWNNVTGWIGNIGSTIRNLKGPLSYDRVMLEDIGEAIIGGLGRGMENEWQDVSRMLSGITAEIPLAVRADSMDALSGELGATMSGTSGQRPATNIEFTVINPTPEPASVSASREMRKLAALGVFE